MTSEKAKKKQLQCKKSHATFTPVVERKRFRKMKKPIIAKPKFHCFMAAGSAKFRLFDGACFPQVVNNLWKSI